MHGLLAAVIALALRMVYLDVLFNPWDRDLYNALENKDYGAFKDQLWRFSYLAFTYIAVAIYRVYLTQALEMRWRAWMARQYLNEWLANQAYYCIEQTHSADSSDQRIAEDLNYLTRGTLFLSLVLLSAAVTLGCCLQGAAVMSITYREAVEKYHQIRWQFVHEMQASDKLAHATHIARYTIRASPISAA